MELLTELSAKSIEIDSLFLNPNNPRLMEKKRINEVADARIRESNIQDSLLKEVQNEGISDIIEKIKQLGFLNIDRIVVRELDNQPDKYLVLEGNRRVASVKTLLKEHADGIITLDETILNSLNKLEVLIYSGADKDIIWILQGMRHINGIKEWGPLQQSRFLCEMQEKQSLRANELDKMTDLGRNTIANKIRSYKAYQYCKTIYHGEIRENNFSLFQEVIFARPIIKDWLEWDDSTAKFKNENNVSLILDWYLGDEEGKTRINRALELRDFLNQVLAPDNRTFLQKFINNADQSAKDILQEISTKDAVKNAQRNQLDLSERLDQLEEVLTSLNTLPVKKISEDLELRDKYIDKLTDIQSTCDFQANILKGIKAKA